ncbi:MAG: type II/IV secretion system protein [Gemmatimonadaceae bacterium]|nr:type II/IV secretion system protein [Gemmatimonadaceae bacterium]
MALAKDEGVTTSGAPPLLDPRLTREYLLRQRACPVRYDDDVVVVAVGERYSLSAVEAIADLAARRPETEALSDSELDQLIERLSTAREPLGAVSDDDGDELSLEDLRELANQPPVARYVNLLLRDAYDLAASDVHLEASREGLVARYRIDGVLREALPAPRALHFAVVSRLKAMASLDVTERRRPQDGRMRVRLADRDLDVRVSSVPTIHGESVVLRFLDAGGRPVDLAALGMPNSVRTSMAQSAMRPHGLVLVTGPTGSGKTTTLYAAMQLRSAGAEKLITVEDPVEYDLPRVTQVPVHRQTGMTFAAVLRTILRQDPDVVMIGEMRDRETAEVAVQAAMTGHLVLSTLHTNDALGAIDRLADLGVPRYLIASTLELIVAQRLVRRVCSTCAGRTRSQKAEEPCSSCRGSGFKGRTGVFEAISVNSGLREAMALGADTATIERLAVANGYLRMRDHGAELCSLGQTTTAELDRVIGS